jgi:hypothetical protein
MAQLKPGRGAIPAGNSSQISDGSAALLFMPEKGEVVGPQAIARVHTDMPSRRSDDHADRADPGREGVEPSGLKLGHRRVRGQRAFAPCRSAG